jgi:hypothetical protein
MSDETTFGERVHVHLQSRVSPDGLRVLLWGDQGMQGLEIDFRARAPVHMRSLETDARGTCWAPLPDDVWPLTRGPALGAGVRDPFQLASRWSYAEMYPARERNVASQRRSPRGDPAASETMRRVYAALADIERRAADLCAQSARCLALRFPFHLRFWVYARLAEDPTGRLAQLACACPGALTFAFGLQEATKRGAVDTDEAARRLLADVVGGRRLAPALRDAVEAWAKGAAEIVRESERWDPVWSRVAYAVGAEREALLHGQQLLIRRAGPMVSSTTLFLPPPISFAAADIPRAVRANARWYRVIKSSRSLLVGMPAAESERAEAFCGFISKNAPGLVRARDPELVRSRVESVRDYVVATGRWPGRQTNARRLLAESARWHRQLYRLRELADLKCLFPELEIDSTSSLPPPPLAGWNAGEVAVAPLTSVTAFIDEGQRMLNCVALRLPAALCGDSALYHATIDGAGLTVELVQGGGRWQLAEAKQAANREPTAHQWEVLRRWESQLG